MTLTIDDVERELRRALKVGEGPFPSSVSVSEIANLAGEEMVNANEWGYLGSEKAQLTIPANAEQVDLPADCAKVTNVAVASSIFGDAHKRSLGQLQRLRENGIPLSPTFDVYWATEQSRTSTNVVMQLEVWPSKTTERTNFLDVYYDVGWSIVTSESTNLVMPSWLHGVYYMFLRAVAKGWLEDDTADQDDRIEKILRSQRFANAVDRDARMDDLLGPMSNTALGVPPSDEGWQYGYRYGEGSIG